MTMNVEVRKKYTYDLKLSMPPTALILTKPTITQKNFVDISNSECFPDRIGNVENESKILFLPLGKDWHYLQRFLRNAVTSWH
jgi:hypothetical protein